MRLFIIVIFIANLCCRAFSQEYLRNESWIFRINDQTFIIDGKTKEWKDVCKHNIVKHSTSDNPTLNSAFWKASWEDDYIIIAVTVNDDMWIPVQPEDIEGLFADKIELYIVIDQSWNDNNDIGYFKIAPEISQDSLGVAREYISSQFKQGNGIKYAENYDTLGNFNIEFYIPYNALPTKDSNIIDPWVTTSIGLDVVIVDVDTLNNGNTIVNRQCWSNSEMHQTSIYNYDFVGLIWFSQWMGDCPDDKVSIKSNEYFNKNTSKTYLNNLIKEYKIFNSSGLLIKHINGNLSDTNFSNLRVGVYIIHAITEDGRIYTSKFIK